MAEYKKDFSHGYIKKYNKFNKNIFCTNCGNKGHEYLNCNFPTTSMGIILIKFDFLMEELLSQLVEEKNSKELDLKGIQFRFGKDIETFAKLKDKIQFLMIQRKHTLGFIEFVRGRYKTDNIDGIIFLFQQMTKEEITKIGSMTFDELWSDFWNDSEKKLLYEKEYIKSKAKFDKLKEQNVEAEEVGLSFYVKNVNPTWETPEWGFPKGRRNKNETDLECAIREFEEESGLYKDDYMILSHIKPLIEEFIGTNGIRYRHIYYVAISRTNTVPKLNLENLFQKGEVGDIRYFDHDGATKTIRPYHVERKKLLSKLFYFMMEYIINYEYIMNNLKEKSEEIKLKLSS
jgi:8-oxo-dGTP pyrophosphatase MutT (NUDIX family)